MVQQATPAFELKSADTADAVSVLSHWASSACQPAGPSGAGWRRVAVVSSRLSKRLDQETRWLSRLRSTLAALPTDSTQVLICERTAGADVLTAGCDLFGLSRLTLQLGRKPGQRAAGLPPADLALFAMADEIRVLKCRPQGNMARLIEMHLNDPRRHRKPVYVAPECLPCLSPEHQLRVRLLGDPEELQRDSAVQPRDGMAVPRMTSTAFPALPEDHPLVCPDQWLCHWTRPAAGPWPGETRQHYCESLLRDHCDHSARGTLLRILAEQRLRASRLAIRGGHPVVSFTAVPLSDFRRRRVFRGHRQRYDFEPWGLAIRRSALRSYDLRPVRYGCDDIWKSLSAADQPWYQKATQDGVTDTVAEQEWRIPQDVDLSLLNPNDAVVFVDSAAAFDTVQPHSRWPVLLLP